MEVLKDPHYFSSSWNNITFQLHPSCVVADSAAFYEPWNKHSLHLLCKISSETAVPKHNLEFKCGFSYLCSVQFSLFSIVLLDSLLIISWNRLNSRQPLTMEKEAVSVTYDTEFIFTKLMAQEDFFASLLCWNVSYIQQLFPYVVPYMLRLHYLELTVMNIW